MTDPIPIVIVTEDILSETVILKILDTSKNNYSVINRLGRRGCTYIKQKILAFNQAANKTPFLVCVDLDQVECPPVLIRRWIDFNLNSKMLFRIAVREIESWLLAHRINIAKYLHVSKANITREPENLLDPKQTLINIARKSKSRTIRNGIPPSDGSTAKIGPNYNAALTEFVITSWDPLVARENSLSLRKALIALDNFNPLCDNR